MIRTLYRCWVVGAKVPVTKVISVTKYLSQFNWFAGSKVKDNNFPRGLATIYLRILQTTDSFDPIGQVVSELAELLKSNIVMYHTPENVDTWKPAHIPRSLQEKQSNLPNLRTLSKNGVLILGKDSGEYLVELLRIKSLLVMKGYKNAKLLKLIEDVPNQSLSQKLRVWGLMCRFSIMVDRKAAGHLNEFEMLKSQDTVIAILRPIGFRSTFMMESYPKSHLIKTFEFKLTPLEVIEEVIKWAEMITKYNENYFNKKYVWRREE
jgi:hypothetical protein